MTLPITSRTRWLGEGGRSPTALIVVAAVGLLITSCDGGGGSGNANKYWGRDDPCAAASVSEGEYADTFYQFWGPSSGLHVDAEHGQSPGSCYVWAQSQASQEVNYAQMFLQTSTEYDGDYTFYAFIPCTDYGTAQGVVYKGFANGTGGQVTYETEVNQSDFCNSSADVFVEVEFNGSAGGKVRVGDKTGASGEGIAFDYVHWDPV